MLTTSAVIFILLALTATGMIGVELNPTESTQLMSKSTQSNSKESVGECRQMTAEAVMGCAILPTDDTFADNLIPSTPQKQSIGMVLIVQDTPSVPVSKNYVFLRFNLSSVLPKGIFTSHARPLNASLWLYARFATGFVNASVRVYHVPSSDWNEDKLTWNNMPVVDMTHFASNQIEALKRWYRWNVTADIVKDIEGNGTSSFALMAGFTSWSNYVWFTSRENATYTPELDVYFREPTLTLTTPLPLEPIKIDGEVAQTDSIGTLRIELPWGVHNVTIPTIIPGQNGVREMFVGWSDNESSASREINIGNNMTLHANYEEQYRLDVNSPYGTASGSGWYFKDEPANASVQPTSVFSEGILGLLGGRHVFDHWTGACTSSQSDCTLLMNGPKETTAVWREDYTVPIVASAIAAIAAGLLLFRRKRKKHT